MKTLLVLSAALSLSAASPARAAPDAETTPPSLAAIFGTVVCRGETVCLSITRAGLAADARLVVIRTDVPQGTAKAEIAGLSPDCAGEPEVDHGYRLRLHQGLLRDGAVGAGVIADPSAVTLRNRVASVRLPGAPVPLVFRSCTSSDGVHVTAWPGQPLAGHPAWHGYVFLNQDLDATCTELELPLREQTSGR